MIRNRHAAWASIFVILFGVALFYASTDGFRAFTAEAARVNQLNQEKPPIPNVTLEDSNGRIFPISELEGKHVFLSFIYTSCGTVCPQLEMNMAEVYKLLPSQYRGEEIVFLTVSFDPARDDVAALNHYKDHFGIDGIKWRMARIPDQNELDTLLKTLGVIVIPDDKGNFTHNAAFYLVDPQGRLAEVMDFKEIDEAAAKIERYINK